MPRVDESFDLGAMEIDGHVAKEPGPHGDKITTGAGGGKGDDSDLHPHAPPVDDGRAAKLRAAARDLLRTYARDCSGFVKAYSRALAEIYGRPEAALPAAMDANELLAFLEGAYEGSTDGRAAKAHADAGGIVYAGLRAPVNGHIMVVVPGPGGARGADQRFYPNVLGGGLNPLGASDGSKTAGDTWSTTDRPRVKYYWPRPKKAAPPKPKPEPEPPKR
ncbi:MAG: hypothetical protein R3B09_25055 [Nannocystaceae bacterium]